MAIVHVRASADESVNEQHVAARVVHHVLAHATEDPRDVRVMTHPEHDQVSFLDLRELDERFSRVA